MHIKRFFAILRDLFLPQPRNACPHCGGIRCIGACQFNDKQPVAAESKATAPAPPTATAQPSACATRPSSAFDAGRNGEQDGPDGRGKQGGQSEPREPGKTGQR